MKIFIGYNLKYGSKFYGKLKGVPKSQILEMPIAENLMSGIALGMSLEGFKPILIFERYDFVLNALDQLINHLAKIKQLSEGLFNPKISIWVRKSRKKPFDAGLQHTQDFNWILNKYFKIKEW